MLDVYVTMRWCWCLCHIVTACVPYFPLMNQVIEQSNELKNGLMCIIGINFFCSVELLVMLRTKSTCEICGEQDAVASGVPFCLCHMG